MQEAGRADGRQASPVRAELRELTRALLQRLRAQHEAATLCLKVGLRSCKERWRRGALSPLDGHVAVEPELHEVGLQVGVRHVQQHLYDARDHSHSARGRRSFPGRQGAYR